MRGAILRTDGYKPTHWAQYPPATTGVFSYFESRVGAAYPETVLFGLDYIVRKYLKGVQVTEEGIREAESFFGYYFGTTEYFNRKGWEHILQQHGGKLPIRIKAVAEGTPVPTGNVMMTVENTDPACYWLTNYVESILTHVWYPSTVATLSREVKKDIAAFLDRTLGNRDPLPYMLHDFGYRGVSSEESAGLGGAAHLINFVGSDTLSGVMFAVEHYDAKLADGIAVSVPATEHSVMTAMGRAGEHAIADALLETYPTGVVSAVGDSYDIYAFVEHVCTRRDEILARDGVFVVRPDSCTADHKTPEDLTLWIVQRLAETFGTTRTEKSFKVLDSHVRVLWGDGIGPDGIYAILHTLEKWGFAANNMIFGMGGGLLQKVNRDTQRFAFKASSIRYGDTWVPVSKQPLDASKASKAGRLQLIRTEDGYETVLESDLHAPGYLLKDVLIDGVTLGMPDFADIKERAAL